MVCGFRILNATYIRSHTDLLQINLRIFLQRNLQSVIHFKTNQEMLYQKENSLSKYTIVHYSESRLTSDCGGVRRAGDAAELLSLSSLVVTLDVVRDFKAATRSAVGRSSSFGVTTDDGVVDCAVAVDDEPLFCRLMRSISSNLYGG